MEGEGGVSLSHAFAVMNYLAPCRPRAAQSMAGSPASLLHGWGQ